MNQLTSPASEKYLRLAIEGAEIGTWHWDLVSDTLVWSDRCRALFGFESGSPVSYARFLDALHPEDRERVAQALRDSIVSGKDFNIEYRTAWFDDSIRWIAARGRAFRGADGQAQRA